MHNIVAKILPLAAILTVLPCCMRLVDNKPIARQTVQFSAVASHSTKCGIIGTTIYPTDEPFRLSAFYGSDSTDALASRFIDTDLVTYDGEREAWRTASDYYWPENGTMLFYAFTPQDSPAIITQEQGVVADYSIETLEDAHKDFCFSETLEDCYHHSYNVPIVFRHALSQHCFKLRPVKNLNYTVEEEGVRQDNTLALVLDSLELRSVYSAGRFYQKPAGWTVKPNSVTHYRLFDAVPGSDFAAECDERNYPIAKEIGTLLLIPQYLHGNNCELVVHYHLHVVTQSTEISTGKRSVEDYMLSCPEARFYLGDYMRRWDIATKYTYHIIVDRESASLEIATTDWTESRELIADEPNL